MPRTAPEAVWPETPARLQHPTADRLRCHLGPRAIDSLLVAVLVAALGAAACTTGDDDDGLPAAIVEELQAVVEQSAEDAVGGTLVRVDTPGAAEELAEGSSDLRRGVELSPGAAFRVASVTKLFTSAVVLQLVEEDMLDLDAPVAQVIPERMLEFEFGEEITARQLLDHTAGLEDYVGFDRELGRVPPGEDRAFFDDLAREASIEDGIVSRSCEEDEHLDTYAYAGDDALFEPGTDWSYSNTGYIVLGEVIETVTGDVLEDVYRQRLLDPLNLDDTWLTCREEPRAALAHGYHAPGALGISVPGQTARPFDVTELKEPYWAAGGLVSTAEDLARIARALFTGELFDDAATLDTMFATTRNPAYGLGVRRFDADVVGHDGLAAGYDTDLRYHRATDTVVVVMINESAVGPAAAVQAEIRSILSRGSPTGASSG